MNLFSSISRGALAMVLLCVVAGTIAAQGKELPSFIQPAHGEVIERWLAQSPRRANLRVATDRDCRNKEGLAAERKERRNYQPYYAAGDFNHDGREDFAVAFVDDRKRRYKFTFAIFNGPFRGASVPAYLNQDSDLSMMGFSWHGRGDDLLLGEFQSDFCVIFKPRGKTYRAQDCLSD
ncbi:MAG TPA: hypothetical protein VMM84_01590 [Pyrinomonadaceae bacterium]|nr:hypothetical protein [Pyrinomonadaceae bacterium]